MGDFVTMVCAILEPERHRLRYASAGHQAPILLRDGKTQGLELGGLPLAVLPKIDYPLRWVELAPGDALILYTDGVTDALNTDGDLFGIERLEAAARRHSAQSARQLLDAILEAAQEFAAGRSQSDDTTVLILRRCD